MLSKVCKMPVTFAKNVSKLPCQNLSIFSKSVQNLSKLCGSVKICIFLNFLKIDYANLFNVPDWSSS